MPSSLRNALIVTLLLITSSANATLVGETQANFQVSPSGAATYSVPIQVPPGINGMQPNLSLNYNSQGGNGLLGLGWNIGGLSAITRCPATIVQDGYKGGIKFDQNDRFCLDGQRLLVVGTSGGVTEYRTAINNFSEIKSYGTAGSGPEYFIVRTKSGQIMEYATTTDSRIEAQGRSDVLIWALAKVEDRNSNYLTITYAEDNANGESYPTDIYYTGNTNQGTTPTNHVQFVYEPRTDIAPRYVGGSVTKTTKRLLKVKTLTDSSVVKEYRLTYTYAGEIQRSQVGTITECVSTGECLPTTIATWATSNDGTFAAPTNGPATSINGSSFEAANFDLNRIKFGDFNGDGMTDIYYVLGWNNNLLDSIYLSNGDGTFAAPTNGPATSINGSSFEAANFDLNRIKFGDFNGDGMTDIYYVLGWNNSLLDSIYLSNGDGTFAAPTNGPATSINGSSFEAANFDLNRIKFGDFNGDGMTDIYYVLGWNNSLLDSIYLSNGDGTFAAPTNGPATSINGSSFEAANFDLNRIKFGDFNGDGMTDIYYVLGWNNNLLDSIYLSNGDGTFAAPTNGPATSINGSSFEAANFDLNRIKFGDFNGDGMTDIYYVLGWNNSLLDSIYLSNGDGTFAAPTNGPATSINGSSFEAANFDLNRIKFGDFNGDGMTDIYYVLGWNNSLLDSIYLSNGDGTFAAPTNGPATSINGSSFEAANFDLNRIKFGDFNGDGMTDIYYVLGWNNSLLDSIYLNNATRTLIQEISNSASTRITIDHEPLTNKDIYTKGTGAVYPERDIQAPIYVVTQTSTDNGINGQAVTNYTYSGMKVNLQGRGSLGFAGMEITDVTGGIRTSIDYRQDYPFVGMLSHTEKRVVSNNALLSESDASYASISPYTGDLLGPVAPYPVQTTDKTYDLNNGQLLLTTTNNQTQDNYGNPATTSVVITGAGETFSETTTNTQTNDIANWCLGMTTQTDVTITAANGSSIMRTSTFGWDNTTCRLTQSTVLPGEGDSLEMTTVYTYDPFGNRITESVSGPVDAARTTTTDYTSNSTFYPDGQFATKVTNALGHFETREYDAKFGLVTKLTGPNGIPTCFEYDELGRQVLERQYCGTSSETTTTTSYAWCDTTCPQYASYMITKQHTGSAPTVVYYDKLHREVRSSRVGFSDRQIFVDTKYDNKGRVVESSEPYFDGDVSYWSIYTYDILGRVETLTPPHTTQSVTTEYNGFTTKVTDVKGRQRSETENAIGQTVSVTDALFNTITYQYDAAGNLTTTTDSAGNVITLTYDKRGRKITMSDPDMGNWSYTYNTFGDLLTQTDAKTQITTLQYDALGRMTSRNSPEGTSSWTYDTATLKGIGKLARMDGPGGNAREFTYDSVGRPHQVIDHIDMQAFTTSRTYDYASRIDTITYPANFAVQQVYKFNGYLQEVRSTDGTVVYWQANSMNARGQLLDSTLANGVHTSCSYNDATGWMDGAYSFNSAIATVQLNAYTFDDVGNLMTRSDQRQGLTESFTYDDLDRVLTADIAGGAGTYVPRTYSYDALGNITNKSDVGNYLYGQGGAGPHAVTQAGANTYAYDANGNMTSGAGRTIGYTSFNKPNAITDSGTTVNFHYGADKSRILKVVGSKRTIYVGLGAKGNALYERESDGTTTKHRHYIYAGGGQAVAIHTNDGATDSMEYLHRDHIGSVEAITDAAGQVTSRMSYDVWGKQRSIDWSDVPLGNYIVNTTNLGFTGHESIPEVGYIHMNGRVYDPVIGRFLSADPNVQTELDSQSYNRYSYVSNNPLRYTDPTGYFIDDLLKSISNAISDAISSISDFLDEYGTTIAAAVISYYTGGLAAGWFSATYTATVAGSIVSGVIAGAVSGAAFTASYVAMNGGNINEVLQAGLMGAVTGAISGGIGGYYGDTWTIGRVISSSVGGGVASQLTGGRFNDGFRSAFISSSARWLYGRVSKTYNKSGKPHLMRDEKNNVGLSGKKTGFLANFTEDAAGMKAVGKLPYMDSFAEFHDGLHDIFSDDLASMIATMPHSYALTVVAAMEPYSYAYEYSKRTEHDRIMN